MNRNTLLKYALKHFDAEPEYLWAKHPFYAVLRHKQSNKWHTILMNVPSAKLGLNCDSAVDILDIKMRTEFVGSLRQKEGIIPVYHMN